VLLGTHLDAPGIVHFQASQATFEAERPEVLQMDGEPINLEWPVTFRVRKRRLRVIVPDQASEGLFSPEDGEEMESV
jgi:diacylglycerol kinase family enzyme